MYDDLDKTILKSTTEKRIGILEWKKKVCLTLETSNKTLMKNNGNSALSWQEKITLYRTYRYISIKHIQINLIYFKI